MLDFDHKPLDGHADNALQIKMLPLKVVVNPPTLQALFDFFRPPQDEALAVDQLQAAAQGALSDVTSQTKAGILFAIEEHKTLDLKLQIDAPIFIFPSKYVLCLTLVSRVSLVPFFLSTLVI